VVVSGDRRFKTDNVVVATGAYQSPRIPSFARTLDPDIVQLHSSEYRRTSQLQEGDTLVVGAGNSGAEIALEASHGHRVLLSGRDTGQEPVRAGGRADRLLTPPFWFLLTRLLTVKTPMGRKFRDQFRSRGLPLARVRRKDLAAAGIERVPRTAGVQDGMPLLDDGRVLEVANVVWCTGFESDFAWIDLPVFDEEGDPLHDRGVVSSQPGLYFLGLYFLSAAASQLVGGAAKDAEYVVKHIASREAEGLPTGGGPRRLTKQQMAV
jgi:putative flavoprotein involved in K+ transport